MLYENSHIMNSIVEYKFENFAMNETYLDHLKYRKDKINELDLTDYMGLVNLRTFTYTMFNRVYQNQTSFYINTFETQRGKMGHRHQAVSYQSLSPTIYWNIHCLLLRRRFYDI